MNIIYLFFMHSYQAVSLVLCSTLDLVTREVDSPLCHLEAAWKTSDQHHSLSARVSGERVSSLLMNTVSG